ncbi:MAG: RNA polymerase subunit sigma [Planctomycetota bacterium]|nr:MAG: RNA polymerase subunit sigma [Planctomycetota bacterium]REK30768.1 MAG: RNA polymerase subunit sigma [Planctomycetota bacterium]REK33143.1 MAG: RNA polymerase subunit sigma [Planctomycetota bacterium]
MSDVTQILQQIESGNLTGAERLLPLVYDELRRLAAQRLTNEKPGQTLQATALVHEAYVRLVDVEAPQNWDSRQHFFSAAAEAMRRILVENARRKRTLRAGGDYQRQEFIEDEIALPSPPDELLALDEALEHLNAKDSRKAKLVELRYFGGLTIAEAADCLGVSVATAERDWTYAKAWLRRQIADDESTSDGI